MDLRGRRLYSRDNESSFLIISGPQLQSAQAGKVLSFSTDCKWRGFRVPGSHSGEWREGVGGREGSGTGESREKVFNRMKVGTEAANVAEITD